MKVKINRVRGGSMGDQRNYGLVTGSIWNYELKPDTNRVSDTLSPIPRDEANIEAERGETIVGDLDNDGMVEHAIVGGKRHFQGGTPLNVPDGSFVFSDYNKLKIKNKDLLKGIFNMSASKGVTPAKVAKRYELNKYKDILNDPESDALDRKTAQLMLDNNMKKLGQLALVQEGMKGFPDGVPDIALPLLGTDFQSQAQPPRMKNGGLVKYQRKGQKESERNVPSVYVPAPPSPYTELAQMQAQYPGNWLNEVEVTANAPFDYYSDKPKPNESIDQYVARVQSNPRFKGWVRQEGEGVFGGRGYDQYMPGATPSYEPNLVTGKPADWVMPSLATGAIAAFGPTVGRGAYQMLTGMGWPGLSTAAKNTYQAVKTGVKAAAPAIYRAAKTPWGRGVIGASVPIIGQEVFGVGKPAETAFTDEEVYGVSTPAASGSYEEPGDYVSLPGNQYQEQIRQEQSRSAQQQGAPARRRSAPAAQPASNSNDLIDAMEERLGRSLTDEERAEVENMKRGGEAMTEYQSRGQVKSPIFVIEDKDVMDAAAAKELESVRPYTYYNPNLPAIGSQLTTSGKYITTPQGIITRKGSTPINIDELKQYPIDWASYGPGGFDDFKKDIAAAGGKESAASKWWVDKVNEYSVKQTGKPIFDISQKGVYVPGYEWSTPAFFKEREKKPEVKKEEAKTESATETKVEKPKFQPTKRYGLGQPLPSDISSFITAATQRIPELQAVYAEPKSSLIPQQYFDPNLQPISAVREAVESVGVGPAARASATGVAGKGLESAAKIIADNAALNRNMFMQTSAQNANILNQAARDAAAARKDYVTQLGDISIFDAANYNKKMAEQNKAFGDMYKNMANMMAINAQYPYQTTTPYGVSVNPELESISQDPLTGGTGGSNLASLWQSRYDAFVKTMTPKEAADAASNYVKSVASLSRSSQGLTSPFNI